MKEIEYLKQENKKLKELIEEYKNRYCEVYENAEQLSRKYYQYKQALEEIKDRLIMPDSLPESYTLKKYILEKCNEVLK